jgi:hypothetical protein
VRQCQTPGIQGNAHRHLPAVVALLFVFAMARLGVFLANAFKMGVGQVVEHDAARRPKNPGLALA